VVYVPFENGKPSGKAQDVVTGFIQGDQAKGRPVGVGIDGTGALLVADDAGNTVWRIASSDGKVTPQPIGTDQVSVNPQFSTNAKTGRSADMIPSVGTETTGSTAQSKTPPASAEERLTDQKPLSGQPDKFRPAQMQIAPAAGP
jgi:hypothetical protein